MTAEAWTAIATCATFGVLLVTAIVAMRQAQEARRLRLEQSRPFVVAHIQPWKNCALVTVENFGRTLARDVRFTFDPPLTGSRPEDVERFADALHEGFPTIVPGTRLRYFLDVVPERIAAGLPMLYSVRVTYQGPTDDRYDELYVLDMRPMLGSMYSEQTVDDVATRLKDVRDELRQLRSATSGIERLLRQGAGSRSDT